MRHRYRGSGDLTSTGTAPPRRPPAPAADAPATGSPAIVTVSAKDLAAAASCCGSGAAGAESGAGNGAGDAGAAGGAAGAVADFAAVSAVARSFGWTVSSIRAFAPPTTFAAGGGGPTDFCSRASREPALAAAAVSAVFRRSSTAASCWAVWASLSFSAGAIAGGTAAVEDSARSWRAAVAGAAGAVAESGRVRSTENHTKSTVAMAPIGSSHFAVSVLHHGRAVISGSVRTIAARSA